ncbi:hypothetical protein [Halobacterium wangiae]|uniref:hypothetical protein n=1 Tax=Halobacterium wangiae TaxID=2902623 RepID=UPI001E47CE62|nr:hypothetical protein [Halobacterium wangiae]
MSSEHTDAVDWVTLIGPALGFAVGGLVAGFATLSAWSNAYMNANPATGTVSGGSPLVVAGLFVLGVAVMFLAASVGLDRILRVAE